MTTHPTYTTGSGIGFGGTNLRASQERRIEWIGKMSDLYNDLLDNSDMLGLLVLADRYESEPTQPMTNTAKIIRLKAAEMTKKMRLK